VIVIVIVLVSRMGGWNGWTMDYRLYKRHDHGHEDDDGEWDGDEVESSSSFDSIRLLWTRMLSYVWLEVVMGMM